MSEDKTRELGSLMQRGVRDARIICKCGPLMVVRVEYPSQTSIALQLNFPWFGVSISSWLRADDDRGDGVRVK